VGTVYVAVARRGLDSLVKRYQFVAERLGFKERTTRMALELVRRGILGLDPNA
jgi:nicotinamide mononucleotide (NMN) deamidase PncC